MQISPRHKHKFQSLLKEHAILTGIKHNPNEIITNLSGDALTPEQESAIRFGLKHGLATHPNESDVIASAESIWEQLRNQNLLPDSFIKQQKIKASIKTLACNFLDFDDQNLKRSPAKIRYSKPRQRQQSRYPKEGRLLVLHAESFR